ncbi:MAG: hypothetical protein LUD54_00115 [Oscillospiraceae bacterium]|nr:hypothetical protein [Oscillospiraceae bacterium]
MPDRVLPGPVETGNSGERAAAETETVNIRTGKIFDACRDKDCIEDLRVYPTVSSQTVINSAISVRPNGASLIYADVNVDAISFNRGYYTVDVTYFYRVCGETFPGGVAITGLAVFDKRVILYGSEGGVKTFSSLDSISSGLAAASCPTAVVEAVNPIALNLRIGEECGADAELRCVPDEIIAAIGEQINLCGGGRPLYVTLGQFSIIRLERNTQLSISASQYYPVRECVGSSDDDPCTLFGRVGFPVDEFFPPDSLSREESYRALTTPGV